MTMVIGVKPQSWLTLGSNIKFTTRSVCIANELVLCSSAHPYVKDSTYEQSKTIFYKYRNVYVLNGS